MLLAAAPSEAKSLTEKSVKASFSTVRPASDVGPCIAEALTWWNQKTSLPAPNGATRIQLSSLYLTLTDILIQPREGGTAIELRGKAYGRVKKSIEGCL